MNTEAGELDQEQPVRSIPNRSPRRPDKQPSRPVVVALSGCGAVTALYYAGALQQLEAEGALRVAALFDPDTHALAEIGSRFPGAVQAASFAVLLSCGPGLVIVASPPAAHAEQTIAALRAGCAVLCEKPLATRFADAEAMVALAAETARLLAVGMVRRFFPSTLAIKDLLDRGAIGKLQAFDCFEGGPFEWPVRSPSYFSRASGGVLMDVGVHALDLIGYWFGPPAAITYEDDAMGGVEADCRIELSYEGYTGCVRLSRQWHRPNRYLIAGSKGHIAWTVNEADRIEIGSGGGDAMDAAILCSGQSASDFHQCFLRQLRAVVGVLSGEGGPIVTGAEALAAMRLIDRCYATRRLMPMGWLGQGELRAAAQFAQMAATS
jgi:predicted dehydrogenase